MCIIVSIPPPPQSMSAELSLASLSAGSLSCPVTESTSIPRNTRHVVGPTCLWGASGTPSHLQRVVSVSNASWHAGEPVGPRTIRSSREWREWLTTAQKVAWGPRMFYPSIPLPAAVGHANALELAGKLIQHPNFAISAPVPRCIAMLAISSTETYDREQSSGSIPSFALALGGKERSVMSLHFPVL